MSDDLKKVSAKALARAFRKLLEAKVFSIARMDQLLNDYIVREYGEDITEKKFKQVLRRVQKRISQEEMTYQTFLMGLAILEVGGYEFTITHVRL